MTEPAERTGANALFWPAALLVVSALGWGILYSLNQLATTDGIPFIPYVFWMGVGAAICWRSGQRSAPCPGSRGSMYGATSRSARSPSA